MTERGLKNVNVFYSTFTDVFCHVCFTFFNVFLFFQERFFYIYDIQVATVACAANSLIDLMTGDLETFLKLQNDWSGWNIRCRKMEMMNS